MCSICYDLFLDIHNNIYCSMDGNHQVVKKSFDNGSESIQIVAGTGVNGSTAYMLNSPKGIFVDIDTNLDLYVADHSNNRIQFFPFGQLGGITIAGNGVPIATNILNRPMSIALDRNKYLFIVDYGNHRIVVSEPYGFRCIVGCSNSTGTALYQLNCPRSIDFDRFGNIFVVDDGNSRIQKFTLITSSNSCNSTSVLNITISISNYIVTNSSNLTIVNTLNNVSYNEPKLDPLAVWNPNGITFADSTIVGQTPVGIFINRNNNIYLAGRKNSEILIWKNDDISPTTTIYTSSFQQEAIFVTINDEILTSTRLSPYEINKWNSQTNSNDIITYADSNCYGLFVDSNNNLYFSVRDRHKVMKKSLYDSSNILTMIAGTGCNGAAANLLNKPQGLFVDVNSDLYVADSGNNRIQLFRLGISDAITVAGSGSINVTIALKNPVSVVLDRDKYVFIVEFGNHRVIGSGPYGFRCIVGCTGLNNSMSNTLDRPTTMAFDSYGNIYVVDEYNNRIQKFLRLNQTQTLSLNQPKLCPNATWNPNATTIANISILGSEPRALFVDTNNNIYAVSRETGQIYMWLNDSINKPHVALYGNVTRSRSVFVSMNGDIYVDDGEKNHQVLKFTLNSNKSILVMSVSSQCQGLFIDVTNTLYCSVDDVHQVFKKWLSDNITTSASIAGTGVAGSAADMLNRPNGIFVDTNFDLYVADYSNHRIQKFQSGQSYAITVAGNTSITTTIELNYPVGVVLDGNKYLFITDYGNHRIVGSGPYGFRCIAGCSGSSGSTADKFNKTRNLAFDTFGNLYVTDQSNNRIQKVYLIQTSCDETITTTNTAISSTDSTRNFVDLLVNYSTFVPPVCSHDNMIGIDCNITAGPCELLNPCQNQGTCANSTDNNLGYKCQCLQGFDGDNCQYDRRPCKSTTCWNNGTCNETSNATFECHCQTGWTGLHCELMVNYCENIICENNGICRSLFMNYTCECLGESYSGRHCEITSTKTVLFQTVSKSFAYVAIIFLVAIVAFIIIMDILKYGFGIDPVKHERERLRREKANKRARRRPVIQRFTYVHERHPTTA